MPLRYSKRELGARNRDGYIKVVVVKKKKKLNKKSKEYYYNV